MTIGELRGIIVGHGVRDGVLGEGVLGGCELLEHIVDVGGFVSLLRGFFRDGKVSFVDDYSDPVGFILGGGVRFGVIPNGVWITYVIVGRAAYYFDGGDV
jgi:hypothetical protein